MPNYFKTVVAIKSIITTMNPVPSYKQPMMDGPDRGELSAKYSELPPPAHNGGLYTGEPFEEGASWRNFPVRPEAVNVIYNNLRNMNVPPEEALYYFPGGGIRPGNNMPELPLEYVNTLRFSKTNAMCIPKGAAKKLLPPPKPTPLFSGNTYLQF